MERKEERFLNEFVVHAYISLKNQNDFVHTNYSNYIPAAAEFGKSFGFLINRNDIYYI